MEIKGMQMMKSKLLLCSILLCNVLAGCQKEEAQTPVQIEPEKEKDKAVSLTFKVYPMSRTINKNLCKNE